MGDVFIDAVNFKHHAARLHFARPEVHGAFTFTHTHFDGLGGHRGVREDTDPDTTLTLHVTGHCTTCSFDLTGCHTLGCHCLQAVGAEVQVGTAFCEAFDPAFVHLAEFSTLWLKHVAFSLAIATTVAACTARCRTVLEFLSLAITRLRIMLHDLTFEDPDLDTDDTIGGGCFRVCVIDVCAQGVQRHTTFTVPFGTCDFCTAQTTSDVHPDTQGAHAHGVLHGPLHRATEGHTALQLLSDGLANELCVEFRLANLNNVQVQLGIGHGSDLLAKNFDVRAFFADDHARTRGVNGHTALLVGAFDDHAGNTGLLALFLDEITDAQIFQQQITIVFGVSVPAAVPGAVDLQAHAN